MNSHKVFQQGDVYLPDSFLPPEQTTHHRIIVLSRYISPPRGILKRHFALVAIVRSCTDQKGQPVQPVFGHSMRISAKDSSVVKHDSFIETHQLFSIPYTEFRTGNFLGRIPTGLLDQCLKGARRLLENTVM